MDSGDSGKPHRRRWYIVVPIVAGLALAAIFIAGRGDSKHRASASIALAPSGASDGTPSWRPESLDYFGREATLMAIARILDTPESRGELEAAGFSPNYTMSVDTTEDPRSRSRCSTATP